MVVVGVEALDELNSSLMKPYSAPGELDSNPMKPYSGPAEHERICLHLRWEGGP